MTTFTSILHPATNATDVHISTGFDDCSQYEIGDKIDWSPQENWPGVHLDGAYLGITTEADDTWVIIKDSHVVAVFDVADFQSVVGKAELLAMFGIDTPDPSLWSDEAWDRDRERKAAAGKRWEALSKRFFSVNPVHSVRGDGAR